MNASERWSIRISPSRIAGRLAMLAAVVAVGLSGLAAVPEGVRAQVDAASVVNPAPFWETAQRAGGNGFDTGYSIAVTEDGTGVVAGTFRGDIYFPTADDSIRLTSAGELDVFVAALSPNGSTFEWAQRAGGVGYDIAESVAVTDDGTVVVAGLFQNTAGFPTGTDDSVVVTSLGSDDLFVATMSADDSYFSWVQSAGGTGEDEAESVAVGPDGSIRVAGFLERTAYFPTGPDDSVAVTSLGYDDLFVAAMSADDSYFSWVQGAGGSLFDQAESVAVARDGTVVVSGQFRDTAWFPTGPDDSVAVTSRGNDDIFVATMSADDSYFSWVQSAGGTGHDRPRSVAVGTDGSIRVAGTIKGTAYFPMSSTDSISLTAFGQEDVFVAALSLDDSYFSWAQQAGGVGRDYVPSVGIANDGGTVVMATFTDTAYFPTSDDSLAITALPDGNPTNIFLAYLPPGESVFSWVQQIEGNYNVSDGGIAIGAHRRVLVTGRFEDTAYFPTADDSISLDSMGSDDVFVSSLQIPAAPAPPVPPGPAVPPSPPADVVGIAGDAQATLSWSPPGSSGSFAVTHYQVEVSPGGASCLAGSGRTSCTVTGLTNGTDYTARVRALSGAGWGSWSTPSASFTPVAPVSKSIVIVGFRDEVRGRPGVIVTGSTSGLTPGAVMRPWVRFPGQVSYREGDATLIVDEGGGFTWQRQTGRKIYVSVRSSDGEVRSNRLVLRRR